MVRYHPADLGPQGFTLAHGRYLSVNQKCAMEDILIMKEIKHLLLK